jgi:hypothetical protein
VASSEYGVHCISAEWWGERCVSDIQQDTVGHSAKNAPLSAMNMQLQRHALDAAECLKPQVLALGLERRQPVGSTDVDVALGVQLCGVLVEARPGTANTEQEFEVYERPVTRACEQSLSHTNLRQRWQQADHTL